MIVFTRTEIDSSNTVYTLEKEPHYRSDEAAVGVIPESVRHNRSANVISAYRYTVCRDGRVLASAMLELSGHGLKRMSQAMMLSKQLVGLSQKLQPYRSILQDFAGTAERRTHFGPYVTLVSGLGEGRARRKLYNLLNLTEKGRLESIDWVLSTPKKGKANPVLYSYEAARMTYRERRNADLVDATLPNPFTRHADGGVRIRCTREEFNALLRKMKKSPELRWAAISFRKSMTPLNAVEKRQERSRQIGAKIRELGAEPREKAK